MLSKKLLLYRTFNRIKNQINTLEVKINNLSSRVDKFNVIKINQEIKVYKAEIELKNNSITNVFDISDNLITNEDWNNLIDYYWTNYIIKMKPIYKNEFEKIKHIHSSNMLELLDKISNESKRMHNYLDNNKIDMKSNYWTNLKIQDFHIDQII